MKTLTLFFCISIVGCSDSFQSRQFQTVDATAKPVDLIVSGDSAYYVGETIFNKALTKKDTLTNDTAEYVKVDKQPGILKFANPKYSKSIQLNGANENCWVKIWVDKTGKPRLAIITSSPNVNLNEPSLIAAMQCRFSPAIMDSKPVSVWISIPFRVNNQ